MLYSILKTIVDTTIAQYTCQSCQGKIDENSLTIGETTDSQIHIDIICPHCQSHAHIHAEVANIQAQITHSPANKNSTMKHIIKNDNAIKDSDIATVSENLQNIQSIEDLLK